MSREGAVPSPGLSSQEASRRHAQYGPNAIESREQRGLLRTLAAVATEPMFLLLLAAAAIYLLIGDLGEGLLLGAFALMTVTLVVLQERRSERALQALRQLAAPQVRVVRDGRLLRIPARELVPGDLFLVGEGERIAADGVLRDCSNLSVDESLLTGEAVPVRKRAHAGEHRPLQAEPGGDDRPFVHAGTLAVSGYGQAEVVAIGSDTRVGRIGAALAGIELAPTPPQRQLRPLVRGFAAGGLALSAALVLWWGLREGDWLQGVLSGIALAMALLPEEFPLALAVFLALGAWRLAQAKVLARRPAVVEALGAATVLCVDKTGTLTENRMRVRRLVTLAEDVDASAAGELPEPVHALLEHAVLASHRGGVDPMDNAILARGDAGLAGTEHLHPQWHLVREYPITPELLAVSHAWTAGDGTLCVAAKGAPEAVADLCHLDAAQAAAWQARVQALADQGLRVLAVAAGRARTPAAAQAHDYDFSPLGLVALEDPLRASVAQAVAQARGAGIAVAMITGDHVATALAIARQAGIDTAAGALGGEALARMDEAQLAASVRRVRVFARMQPEQKLRLVQALRANGETVAMTGDGVNDAPALKAAHIGIAMGVRGTDVAREAASVVLLEEDFGRIVEGVRLGRRIHDNLRKVMGYILAVHVPIAGLALLPLLLGLPPLMLPAHVLLSQMIIDPVCSLAFENAPPARDLMQRPPRPAGQPLLDAPMAWQAIAHGAAVLGVALAGYALSLRGGAGADEARTLAIVCLTAGNLALVWAHAARGLGPLAPLRGGFGPFWAVAAVATGVLALGIAVPAARALLRFALPSPGALALAVGAAFAAVGAAVAVEAAVQRLRAWPALRGSGIQ